MREIVGYAPVEPDGSVEVQVPADVAFRIAVVDANGRNISPGLNVWLQALPGEVVTCNGCHKTPTPQAPLSHGRAGVFAAAYAGSTTGAAFPGTFAATYTATDGTVYPPFLPIAGETMAEARARTTCVIGLALCSESPERECALHRRMDRSGAGRHSGQTHHAQLQRPEGDARPFRRPATARARWASNCRIIINYPAHIQPIWDQPRPTTVRCDNPGELHLPTRWGMHLLTGGLPQPHGCECRRAGPRGTAQSDERRLERRAGRIRLLSTTTVPA